LTSELTLSVVIPNYNYAKYVGTAIKSALELRWPNVEVIVVDDGSTDDSLEVIQAFGDKIVLIKQANVGQLASCKNGFSRSKGDLIIFLDSDDVLHPELMTEIAAVWTDRASKFQFQMRIVDAQGIPTGSIFPQYLSKPAPKDILKWIAATGAYPTPPGSGNAYPRWLVQYVFGFKSDFEHRAPDSYLLAAAPACGDVITIVRPLADYRVHGLNDGAFLELDETRFAREVSLTRRRHMFFTEIANDRGLEVSKDALNRNLVYLCLRTASYTLRPDIHPVAEESSARILVEACRAVTYPQGYSHSQRASLLLWIVAVIVAPARLRETLISWRYASAQRPRWVRSVLSLLRAVR
jgi:glycosyltransferase involved in cell wall biosynthesis